MRYLNHTMIVLALFAASCEKTVTVNPPAHESRVVATSSTTTGDRFFFSLTKTVPVLSYSSNKDYSIKDAAILLKESGQIIDTLYFDANAGGYTSGTRAEQGKTYEVVVNAPGLPAVSAVATAPAPVAIKALTRLKEVQMNKDGMVQDEIRISFDDPVAAGDYYIVKVFAASPLTDSFKMPAGCVNSHDPSIESWESEGFEPYDCLNGDAIFLRDQLFNGATKELRLFVSSYSLLPWEDTAGNISYPYIELYHVSEDYFKYLKSYHFAAANNGNPFAEPTNVHTNVRGGYGVFSIESRDRKEIK